jgi:hypothetical protein
MSASSSTVNPESAVRVYLQYLENPGSLVDEVVVKRLEGEYDKARDPVERLKTLAALGKARSPDESNYRTNFVRYAKQWADQEGVPATAFRELGVPADVLLEAGLDPRTKGRRDAKAKAKAATTTPQRRRPVKAAQLEEAVLSIKEPFTVKDLVDRCGASPMTIKNVLDRLVAQEKVIEAGERRGARGRAAKLWTVA